MVSLYSLTLQRNQWQFRNWPSRILTVKGLLNNKANSRFVQLLVIEYQWRRLFAGSLQNTVDNIASEYIVRVKLIIKGDCMNRHIEEQHRQSILYEHLDVKKIWSRRHNWTQSTEKADVYKKIDRKSAISV